MEKERLLTYLHPAEQNFAWSISVEAYRSRYDCLAALFASMFAEGASKPICVWWQDSDGDNCWVCTHDPQLEGHSEESIRARHVSLMDICPLAKELELFPPDAEPDDSDDEDDGVPKRWFRVSVTADNLIAPHAYVDVLAADAKEAERMVVDADPDTPEGERIGSMITHMFEQSAEAQHGECIYGGFDVDSVEELRRPPT